jgi:hypothetical protein
VKQEPDIRSRLRYHARMFALAALAAVTIFFALLGVAFVGLWLGLWELEDR